MSNDQESIKDIIKALMGKKLIRDEIFLATSYTSQFVDNTIVIKTKDEAGNTNNISLPLTKADIEQIAYCNEVDCTHMDALTASIGLYVGEQGNPIDVMFSFAALKMFNEIYKQICELRDNLDIKNDAKIH